MRCDGSIHWPFTTREPVKFPVSSRLQPASVCQVTWLWTLSWTPSIISISPPFCILSVNDTFYRTRSRLTEGQVAVALVVQKAGQTPYNVVVQLLLVIMSKAHKLTTTPRSSINIEYEQATVIGFITWYPYTGMHVELFLPDKKSDCSIPVSVCTQRQPCGVVTWHYDSVIIGDESEAFTECRRTIDIAVVYTYWAMNNTIDLYSDISYLTKPLEITNLSKKEVWDCSWTPTS